MSTPDALSELLNAAEAALEHDDPRAAEAAAAAALRACEELARDRVELDRELLARLSAQHARIEAHAVQAREALALRLQDLGRSRRAAVAYRRG